MTSLVSMDAVTKYEVEAASAKFDASVWKEVEKPLTKFDNRVNNAIISYIAEVKPQLEYIEVLGDDFYLLIRDSFEKPIQFVPNRTVSKSMLQCELGNKGNGKGKGKGKKGEKTLNTCEIIRIENTRKRLTETVQTLLKSFNQQEFSPYIGFRLDIVELRGITFLYCIQFIMLHQQEMSHQKYLPFILGIIIAAEKIMDACATYMGRNIFTKEISIVSPIFIEDFRIRLGELKAKYPFDGLTISRVAPELIVYTEYDYAIPTKEIALRENQLDILNKVKKNFATGFVLGYVAMIASGKTTCSIGIAQFISDMRQHRNHSGLELLFCCNLASVKSQVARLCFNTSIKFGVAHIDNTGNIKINNQDNCKRDEDRIVTICSPDAAFKLLMEARDPGKYMLFLDEPTIGADIDGSRSLQTNVKVMMHMPRWTILSSATLPPIEDLAPFYKNIIDIFPETVVDSVYSREVQIGCDVRTFDGELVMPHLGCRTSEELLSIISSIEMNPFLGRLYTSNVLQTLWKELMNRNIKDVPDIREIFSHAKNLKADNVRHYCIKMLKVLATQSNEYIENVCSSTIFEPQQKKKKQEDLIVFEDESVDESTIDFTKLGTGLAYKFINRTLIATNNPHDFAVKHFQPLLEDLNTHGCKNAKHVLTKYRKEMDLYKLSLEKIERNIENEDKLSKRLQEIEETHKPKINFPNFGQINTSAHIEKYAQGKTVIKRFTRLPICLEDIPIDTFSVSNELLLLLFCGVGIYCPSGLDKAYCSVVLSLAAEGKLAYVVADSSLSYGANYPFNKVIETEDFATTHSINTGFQVWGRAGRVGQSYKAEVFIPNIRARQLIEFTRGDHGHKELDNMLSMLGKSSSAEEIVFDECMAQLEKDMARELEINDRLVRLSEIKKSIKPKTQVAQQLSEQWFMEHMLGIVVPKVTTNPTDVIREHTLTRAAGAAAAAAASSDILTQLQSVSRPESKQASPPEPASTGGDMDWRRPQKKTQSQDDGGVYVPPGGSGRGYGGRGDGGRGDGGRGYGGHRDDRPSYGSGRGDRGDRSYGGDRGDRPSYGGGRGDRGDGIDRPSYGGGRGDRGDRPSYGGGRGDRPNDDTYRPPSDGHGNQTSHDSNSRPWQYAGGGRGGGRGRGNGDSRY